MIKKILAPALIVILAFSIFAFIQAAQNTIHTEAIDSVGDGGHHCSIALDENGYPHISYHDGGFSGLECAWWNGHSWTVQLVDDGGVTGQSGLFCSLKLDVNGNPHISYTGVTPEYHCYLSYAYWNGQRWITQIIDAVAWTSSLAFDSAGNPHIAYSSNYSLRYASYDGLRWNKQIVDPGVYMKVDVGLYDSLQLDSNDNPHVSYYDKTNKTLRYAFWNGTNWNTETLDHSEVVEIQSSLALDSNGNPHISYCCDEGLRYAVWNGSSWEIQTIDISQFLPASDGAFSSLALDSKGKPHISYIDQSRSDVLKYAFLNESSWQIYTISEKLHGGFTSALSLDSNDTVHIVHGDHENHVLEYVHFDPATLAGPSQAPIFVRATAVIFPEPYAIPVSPTGTAKVVDPSYFAGTFTSLAVDAAGNDHVSYCGGLYGLKYAYCNGTHWLVEAVDVGPGLGLYNSLALDSNSQPHISYVYNETNTLKYAWWDGSQWKKQTVDKDAACTSIVLDSNGYPLISYFDSASFALKYSFWNGSSWQTQIVDSTAHVGEFSSIALDSDGNPHISYYDATNGNLKYASSTGSGWKIQTVDTAGDVGWSTSLKLDKSDNAHISYLDETNTQLKYAEWNGSSWCIQIVDSVGFANLSSAWYNQTSLALDANGYPHVSYFDGINDTLKYAYWNGTGWTIQTADSSFNVGYCSSLALDSSGRAHISYHTGRDRNLKCITSIDASGFNPPPTPTPTPTSKSTSSSSSSTSSPTATPLLTTKPSLLPSVLEVTCKSVGSLSSSLNVQIFGKLRTIHSGISNVDIDLFYSADGGKTWSHFAATGTNSIGSFSKDWQLPGTGTYLIRATWQGNATYEAATKTISFALAPMDNHSVVSVISNSTVSELFFNSTNKEFRFNVDGSSGTTGYVSLCIPKPLVNDTRQIKVYIDGTQVSYDVETQDDCWLISFTYFHSSHKVIVQLNPTTIVEGNFVGYWIIFGSAVLIAVTIISVSLIYITRRPQQS